MNDELTEKVIGIAIAVHRELGPGFLETIYEAAMAIALTEAGMAFERQVAVPILYHGQRVGEHRLDLLVEKELVVELKARAAFEDVHFAITRSYLRATKLQRALLLNFAAPTLQVKRVGAEFRGRVS